MLIDKSYFKFTFNKVSIMSTLRVEGGHLEKELTVIAKQMIALATGLQIAAPGDKAGLPNKSVNYLNESAKRFLAIVELIKQQTQSTPAHKEDDNKGLVQSP